MILRTLEAFPSLTKSMLAAHVRPYDPEGWRNTLDKMIEEGVVIKTEAAPLGKLVGIYSLRPKQGEMGEDGN
jgi:hypothetical protein